VRILIPSEMELLLIVETNDRPGLLLCARQRGKEQRGKDRDDRDDDKQFDQGKGKPTPGGNTTAPTPVPSQEGNFRSVAGDELSSRVHAPNTKHQRSSKSQAPRQRACGRFWHLKFGISLELGVWDLVFRSLGWSWLFRGLNCRFEAQAFDWRSGVIPILSERTPADNLSETA
jgi:hypothetical protein